jgi:hypothetical protein
MGNLKVNEGAFEAVYRAVDGAVYDAEAEAVNGAVSALDSEHPAFQAFLRGVNPQ